MNLCYSEFKTFLHLSNFPFQNIINEQKEQILVGRPESSKEFFSTYFNLFIPKKVSLFDFPIFYIFYIFFIIIFV